MEGTKMRREFYSVLIIAFILAAAPLYSNYNESDEPARCSFIIKSKYEGEVYHYGRRLGKTNEVIKVTIDPGKSFIYDLVIQNDSKVAGTSIYLLEGELVTLAGLSFVKRTLFNQTISTSDYADRMHNLQWSAYLIGITFPLTNLLGIAYYANPIMLEMAWSIPPIPLSFITASVLCLSASIATLSSGGYQYFHDMENVTNRNLFISSVVTGAMAYLINLTAGMIVLMLDRPSFSLNFKRDRAKLLERMVLGYDFNRESFLFSYSFQI